MGMYRKEYHGHILVKEDSGWVYEDSKEPFDRDNLRPCPHCNKELKKDGMDPCLGELPGVVAACCGHGGRGFHSPYIMFENGIVINNFETVNFYSRGDKTKESYVVDLKNIKPA